MEKLWEAPSNDILIDHLMEMSIYDLDRLEKCFRYEYKVHPENEAEITDILKNIEYVRKGK